MSEKRGRKGRLPLQEGFHVKNAPKKKNDGRGGDFPYKVFFRKKIHHSGKKMGKTGEKKRAIYSFFTKGNGLSNFY